MSRSAQVLVNEQLAGMLKETAEGEFIFQYEPTYLENALALPVSLTLPKQTGLYRSPFLFPFFDGLIPEGWLLEIAYKNWKINPRDRMGLLLHLCQDTIGNVSIVEIQEHKQ